MSIAQVPPSPAPVQTSFSFTQGFLLGQFSVVLFIGAFIKFFIFGEAPPARSRASSRRDPSPKHTRTPSLYDSASSSSPPHSLRHKPSTNNILRPAPSGSTNTASILRKTYYQTDASTISKGHRRGQSQHSSHQPESLDWFNVLIAQTISQYRQAAYNLKDTSPSEPPSILTTLTAALNDPEKKPSFLDTINVTEISLGEEFPIFSNCRVIAVDDEGPPGQSGGRLQALVDVDLSDDNLTLAIETSLILNYPKPRSAVLPVALGVSVVKFSGTLCISFVPAASPPTAVDASTPGEANDLSDGTGAPKTNLTFSFLPDYRLELSVRSLLGSRSRLQDVPKIAQLIESQVLAWFEDRVVEPRVQVVGLPGLWPRMKRTGIRGGEEGRPESQDGGKSEGLGIRRGDFSSGQDAEGLRWRGSTGLATPRENEGERMPGSLPGMTVVAH